MDWFKMYSEAGTDPKLGSLTDAQHRVWFRLLCKAAKTNGTFSAGNLRVLAIETAGGDADLLAQTLGCLDGLDIIRLDEKADGVFIHFAKRQARKPSDVPAAAAQRQQAKRQRDKVTSRDVTPRHAMSRAREEENREEVTTPLAPQGEEEDLPFTEFPPGGPDDEPVDRALEEVAPKGPVKKAQRAPKPGLWLEGFEDWYKGYPRKRQREAAEAAWDKLRPDAALRALLARCLEHQKAWPDWTKDDGSFIPYPASYLNGRQWRDAADELAEKGEDVTAPNPYAAYPWWSDWMKHGEQPTYIGVLNFCASVAPNADPREAGQVFKTAGFKAAIEYVIERRNAG